MQHRTTLRSVLGRLWVRQDALRHALLVQGGRTPAPPPVDRALRWHGPLLVGDLLADTALRAHPWPPPAPLQRDPR